MSNQKAAEKIELTLKIDQTILADFQEMVQEVNEMECNCNEKHLHTIDECIEAMMKNCLRTFHIDKASRKYTE